MGKDHNGSEDVEEYFSMVELAEVATMLLGVVWKQDLLLPFNWILGHHRLKEDNLNKNYRESWPVRR